MSRVKITVSVLDDGSADERTLHLGSVWIKKWGLSTASPLILRFGSLEREMRLVENGKGSLFRIHPRLAAELGIHAGAELCLRHPGGRVLSLGPLLGVLLTRIGDGSNNPFGAISSFCRELTMAGEKHGVLVYFFSAGRLPGKTGRIQGWTYHNGWRQRMFPLPDVVYNRLTSRVVENRPEVQRFLQQFKKRPEGGLFNERYVNKAEVFEALRRDETLKGHLPESYTYKSKVQLRSMLERHGSVFLKPNLGSLGKGIVRIRKGGDGTYLCHAAGSTGAIREIRYPNQVRMMEGVALRVKGRPYLLQEGLDLISVGGCPLDFRALVQRDDTGEWKVTSIVGRIAARHTFVSNLARGGRLSTVPDAIAQSNLAAALRGEVKGKLDRAALALAKGLEQQLTDAHFAEFGIDLAVDTRGRVMLLEVNSKPSKENNAPLGAENGAVSGEDGPVKIRPSVRRAVQYARFMAKF